MTTSSFRGTRIHYREEHTKDRFVSLAKSLRGRLEVSKTALLTVSGFGLVDAAFFQLSTFAGLLAAGISALTLGWLVEQDGSNTSGRSS